MRFQRKRYYTGKDTDNNSESEQGSKNDNGDSEGKEEIKHNEPTVEDTENDVNTGLQEETNNGGSDVLTADTTSLEKLDSKPDSTKKGVMWPIAAAGACVVVVISAIVVAKIRKK